MTSTRLVLVRHGQHDYAVADGGLTDVGERQAELLATELELSEPDLVVSSPLKRARETTHLFGVSFEVVDDLREFDFGSEFAGGETLSGFQARVAAAMERLTARRSDTRVVACTHSDVIDGALRWAYGLDPSDESTTEAVVRNASITELEVWHERRTRGAGPMHVLFHRVGDVAYLPSELVTDI